MSKSLMPRADFVTGLVVFVLGVFMAVEGAGMPGPEQVSYIEEGGEPGRVPILVGVILAVFAAILLMRAVRDGGHRIWEGEALDAQARIGAWRSLATAAGCTVYAVGLVGASVAGWDVPYELATAVFVFGFIVAFEWAAAPGHGAALWARILRDRPGFAGVLQSTFGFVSARRAPYVWLIANALVQAVIVTAAVTYLFEQQFYVTLP